MRVFKLFLDADNIKWATETLVSAFDATKIIIYNNTFEQNLAIGSNCLYVSGASAVKVLNNVFTGNAWTTDQTSLVTSSVYTNNAYYKLRKSLYTLTAAYSVVTASTPLVLRLVNNALIENNVFNGNGFGWASTVTLPIGAAIAIERTIGAGTLTI